MTSQKTDELEQDRVLQEYRFRSQTPLIGPLIERFRTGWHNIAGKWAIRYIAQQQSTINQQLQTELTDAQACLALADHDLMVLTRTVAELTQQVIQLRQTVAELEKQQAALRNETHD